jgi:hypothetical protein
MSEYSGDSLMLKLVLLQRIGKDEKSPVTTSR